MADIDVVQKQGGKGWMMWLLLAIAAVAIIWMLMARNNTREEVGSTSVPTYEPAPAVLVV